MGLSGLFSEANTTSEISSLQSKTAVEGVPYIDFGLSGNLSGSFLILRSAPTTPTDIVFGSFTI